MEPTHQLSLLAGSISWQRPEPGGAQEAVHHGYRLRVERADDQWVWSVEAPKGARVMYSAALGGTRQAAREAAEARLAEMESENGGAS